MRQLLMNEVKEILLEILLKFDEYCTQNGLRYYLCGGALIGAIRHKGFIPWDDDIDVLMPRPDYERLIELERKKKISDTFDLFTYKNRNSNLIFIKLGDITTQIYNKYQVENECISIDIFPIDGMSNENFVNKKRFNVMKFYHYLYSLKLWRFGNATSLPKNIIKSICYPISLTVNHSFICNKMDMFAKKYSFEHSYYIGDIIWGYGVKEIVSKEEFLPQVTVKFENYEFKTTQMYDKYLSQVYGDYMSLPPEEKRKNHELIAYR